MNKDLMENVSHDNALIIANQVKTLKTEVNTSGSYRKNTIKMFCAFSRFFSNKLFDELEALFNYI